MAAELSSRTFFHCLADDADPEQLLDPNRHFTEPWGDSDHGDCDKCGDAGTTLYECRSCLERGAEADCPACHGRVRFEETCPTCEGSGMIDRTRRRGIAVFPSAEGLYRYLVERDGNVEGSLIVALEGRLSDDRDLDADAGALLVHPERILEVRPVDREIVRSIQQRLGVESGENGGIESA
jgi:hypothetical protein